MDTTFNDGNYAVYILLNVTLASTDQNLTTIQNIWKGQNCKKNSEYGNKEGGEDVEEFTVLAGGGKG